MADEFEDEAGAGPSESELQKAYGSKYLSATDLGNRKIKAKIARVTLEDLRQQDGSTKKKAVLALEGQDKMLVLNAGNYVILKDGLGPNASKWIGRTIGLKSVPRTMGGKPTRGIEVVILGEAFTAKGPSGLKLKPAPKPEPKTEETPWPKEDGDPGFGSDPDDFRDAAE